MNLKRFLALGAMILGVGFFGASPAKATPHYTPSAPCIDWNVASTVWATANAGDTHFFICDGSYQNHMNPSAIAISGVRNATQWQSAVVRKKMLDNNIDVFVFKNATDYNNYVGALAPHVPAGAIIGFTTLSMQPLGPHNGGAIAMMENILCPTAPTGCTTANYTDMSRSVNHEVGHAIDNVMGLPSTFTGAGTFRNQLDADKITFNAQTVNWSGLPSPCTSQVDNWHKLKCSLLNGYADGSDEDYAEWWAHCYATKKSNGSFPAFGSSILNSYFHKGGMPPSGQNHACDIVTNIAETP